MANPEHVAKLNEGVQAWNSWRSEFACYGYVPLTIAEFVPADLRGAKLERLDLSRADFAGVNLGGADLSGAILRGSDLRRANLWGANLSNADLSCSDLTDACLKQSNLAEARFDSAVFGSTEIDGIDLSTPVGIGAINHKRPSELRRSTVLETAKGLSLRRARRDSVEIFFRGCGLEDWEIVTMRLLSHGLNDQQLTDVLEQVFRLRSSSEPITVRPFISYSHADREFAVRLHDELQSRGVRCWRDEKDLLPGHQLSRRIDEAIRLSDRTLLVCSICSLKSQWVHDEIRSARQQAKSAEFIIPIVLDGALFVETDVPHVTWVRDHVAADFRDWRNEKSFTRELDRLILALREAGKPMP